MAIGSGLGLGLSKPYVPWYLRPEVLLDGTAPTFYADYANQRYAVGSVAKTFDDVHTFTRASTGTYIDSAGLIQEAAVDVPRFTHDPETLTPLGLLLELAVENLVPNSTDPSTWASVSATITDTGEDIGILNKVTIASTGATWHRADALQLQSWTINVPISVLFYYIVGTSGQVRLVCRNSTSGNETIITGTPGSLSAVTTDAGSVADIVEIDHGVYRSVSFTFTPNATITNNGSFAIGPNSAVSGETIFALGGQVELGSSPTSLIVTSGTAATRSADVCSNSAANVAGFSWYQDGAAGTIYSKAAPRPTTAGLKWIVNIDDGTANDRQSLFTSGATAQINTFDGGAFQAGQSFARTATETMKLALAFDTNDIQSSYNGTHSAVDTSAILPTGLTHFRPGMTPFGAQPNAPIAEARYYPVRGTQAELNRITS